MFVVQLMHEIAAVDPHSVSASSAHRYVGVLHQQLSCDA